MSRKYLGDTFDIHGGGMDLAATHHTNEIAQSQACNHNTPANYWMHTNMLTVNGVRMSKSAGNGFLPEELFTGNHPLLEKGYSPMTVRFFMMQTHYRSTLDFSNEALQASEKGFKRLIEAMKTLEKLNAAEEKSTSNIDELRQNCDAAMNDDFNTPIVIANLFEAVRIINSANDGTEKISADGIAVLKKLFNDYIVEVLGLLPEESTSNNNDSLDAIMKLIVEIRNNAKQNKDYTTSDKIRDELLKANIELKDSKDGTNWNFK